ncbi:MAG TPA: 2-amino-4-hydroxy-6-hydroxymethyldihydropteridine diphosphokinase [Candidatus Krumholzibacteria bacterium]|nr:2-amino-4-hydroxy-6-hydroxymethyldihydropteridine diphosphokinase [Candidatus Krumholzibacteria bacterium]
MIAYVGLGSNLGRREAAVLAALRTLESSGAARVNSLSSLYESEADGIPGAPRFINAVAEVEPLLPASLLLERMQSIEAGMGRSGGHQQSREIDLDLITYGAETGVFGPLTLPHPRFHSRSYVLIPLQEIAPGFVCPKTGRAVSELVAALGRDGTGVERVSGRMVG